MGLPIVQNNKKGLNIIKKNMTQNSNISRHNSLASNKLRPNSPKNVSSTSSRFRIRHHCSRRNSQSEVSRYRILIWRRTAMEEYEYLFLRAGCRCRLLDLRPQTCTSIGYGGRLWQQSGGILVLLTLRAALILSIAPAAGSEWGTAGVEEECEYLCLRAGYRCRLLDLQLMLLNHSILSHSVAPSQ